MSSQAQNELFHDDKLERLKQLSTLLTPTKILEKISGDMDKHIADFNRATELYTEKERQLEQTRYLDDHARRGLEGAELGARLKIEQFQHGLASKDDIEVAMMARKEARLEVLRLACQKTTEEAEVIEAKRELEEKTKERNKLMNLAQLFDELDEL